MALLLDTGPVFAALNNRDPDHRRCQALLESGEDFAVPCPALVEIHYWLIEYGGARAWASFAEDVVNGAYRVIHLTEADLARTAELELAYGDLRLGFVDASIVALAERLGETRIATLDHRHFSVVRPRHCPHLTLLPE
ncbi:MAG TPA: PIN domain-containing protein [Candidatus Binatia bacterium]|nr:PIN domain-containing protein [Candidatus Binatia bacterium]